MIDGAPSGAWPLTNRITTAGSGRCAESEAAAIVTKVTVGQYVKLQVWTKRSSSATASRRSASTSLATAILKR